MHPSSKKLINLVFTSLIVIAFAAAPATLRAQNPEADIKSDPVEGKLEPALIHVNKRPPIPFKPFDTVDPSTGKRVSPDTIVTFNGKKVSAGELKSQLDQLERRLNQIGHTLRGSRTVQFQSIPVPAALPKQAQALRAAQIPNSTFRSLDVQAAEAEQKAMISAPRINVPDTILNDAKPLHFTRNWNESLGNPNVFSAFIKGRITLDGAKDLTTIAGEASAGGSMIGHSFDLLRVSGNLRAPRTGPMNAKMAVRIAGVSVFNLDENVNTSLTKRDFLQKTVDKSVSFHITLFLIPVSIKVGFQGSAGVAYAVALAPIRASAHFAPFVRSKVYAQASVSLFFIEGGARATLTLLNTDGHLTGAISIEGSNYKWTDSYCQNLDMLSGKVTIFVTFNYILDSYTKDFDLFTFSGLKASGCLFNDSKTMDFTKPLVLHQ